MKAKNRKLEDTISLLKRDLQEKESENEELTESLEMFRSFCETKELAQRKEF